MPLFLAPPASFTFCCTWCFWNLSLSGVLSGMSVLSFAETPFWAVVSFVPVHESTDFYWNHSTSNSFFPLSLWLWVHTFVLIWYHLKSTLGGKRGKWVCSVHPCELEHILFQKSLWFSYATCWRNTMSLFISFLTVVNQILGISSHRKLHTHITRWSPYNIYI